MIEISTALVPRSLYPNKAQPISIRFGDAFFSDYIPVGGGGVLTMLPAEAYWNFNVFGFVIAGCFLGVFCRYAYLILCRIKTLSALWVYCFLWELSLWMVETPTQAGVVLLSHGIPVVCIVCLVAVTRRQSPQFGRVIPAGYSRSDGRMPFKLPVPR
jgi:hypothetical protein